MKHLGAHKLSGATNSEGCCLLGQSLGVLATRSATAAARARAGDPPYSQPRPKVVPVSRLHFANPSTVRFLAAAAALCFFTSFLLWALLQIREPSPFSSSYTEFVPSNEVTYGSVVKLMHERTRYRLHSHEIPYGSGSGQQSVTSYGGVEDANSYWVVREPNGSPLLQGSVIPHGSIIRLQHMQTRKWLHSHLHASPISMNLEVSCFGGETESDTGDHWRLEIEGPGEVWMKDQRVTLQHVDTQGFLHTHDRKYYRIVTGQQEVCGVTKKSADSIWIAAEGVYLPVNQESSN